MNIYKYYFGSYTEDAMYLKMDESGDIPFWNIYSADGKMVSAFYQNGTSDLDYQDFMSLGRLLEIHRQVKLGLLEYDPYILKHRKEKHKL